MIHPSNSIWTGSENKWKQVPPPESPGGLQQGWMSNAESTAAKPTELAVSAATGLRFPLWTTAVLPLSAERETSPQTRSAAYSFIHQQLQTATLHCEKHLILGAF